MSKWDARMLAVASLISGWSKDPSTGVGAVIVDPQNRVVSMGFNGFPRAVKDSASAMLNRDEKLRRTIHAEDNALLFARRDVAGCSIYVTHPPCCAVQPVCRRPCRTRPCATTTLPWRKRWKRCLPKPGAHKSPRMAAVGAGRTDNAPRILGVGPD